MRTKEMAFERSVFCSDAVVSAKVKPESGRDWDQLSQQKSFCKKNACSKSRQDTCPPGYLQGGGDLQGSLIDPPDLHSHAGKSRMFFCQLGETYAEFFVATTESINHLWTFFHLVFCCSLLSASDLFSSWGIKNRVQQGASTEETVFQGQEEQTPWFQGLLKLPVLEQTSAPFQSKT